MSQLSRRVSCVLLGVFAGCNAIDAHRADHEPGKVLVLPPRDVVQRGDPHEAGAGSGKALQDAVVVRFRETRYEPVVTDSSSFTNASVATKAAALEEARRLGASYCLQLVLGEFRDAAAMTFRSDFVTLQDGVMWDVATGVEVWRVAKPWIGDKGNIGGYRGILEVAADAVVDSIAR